jgi:hypothetical protein
MAESERKSSPGVLFLILAILGLSSIQNIGGSGNDASSDPLHSTNRHRFDEWLGAIQRACESKDLVLEGSRFPWSPASPEPVPDEARSATRSDDKTEESKPATWDVRNRSQAGKRLNIVAPSFPGSQNSLAEAIAAWRWRHAARSRKWSRRWPP